MSVMDIVYSEGGQFMIFFCDSGTIGKVGGSKKDGTPCKSVKKSTSKSA